MNKAELKEKTKADLVKLAKRIFGLALKPALVKDEMISLIQKADRAKRKLSAAKPAKKAKPATKKTTAKRSAAAKPTAKKAAKKSAAPVAAKRKRTAKAPAAEKPVAAKPAARKTIVDTVAIPAPPQNRPNGGEEAVTESKYYVAPVQEHIHPTYEPQERYGDDRVTLLVRDPHWIFSYWDMNDDTPGRVAHSHGIDAGHCDTALRVYDVTGLDFDGTNGQICFDLGVGGMTGSYYINVPSDGRSYCVEIGLKDGQGSFYVMARSNVITVPRASVSDRMDEEWMIADEEFWEMYSLSGGFGPVGSSEELAEQMQKRLAGEEASGAVSSFSSEAVVGKKNDDFWFRLDCELIVYGATEPDAVVTLGDKPVTLRPDGTFTARFAMPDGLRVLPARAVSASHKHEKTITPTLSRSTTSFEDINRETENT
ncbi:MAG: DUF4912 domain-containing protein [Nitrospinota bacterium]